MNEITNLRISLLDILHELSGSDIKIIIGGGFGIYLKRDHVHQLGVRTLLDIKPEARSTNDLDLFLRPELFTDLSKLELLDSALKRLNYEVMPGAEYYQFRKPGPNGSEAGSVKLDLLTGPRSHFDSLGVRVDRRRVRPRPSARIHAHPVDEALTLEKGLTPVVLEGELSSGESWKSEVHLPHPYTFSIMKMFAFRDRLGDADNDYGSYHVLDLYTIVATTTDTEWEYALKLRDENRTDPTAVDAGKLVAEYFSSPAGMGIIRLKESKYYRPEFQIEKFMSVLQELFPSIL